MMVRLDFSRTISREQIIGLGSAVSNMSDYRCVSDCRSRGASLIPARSHTFVEIDHEIISMVILQCRMSVTRESMCTKYWLVQACQGKGVAM